MNNTNEDHIKDTIELLRQKKLNYEINQMLAAKNIDKETCQEILTEAQKRYEVIKKKKQIPIWACLLLLIITIVFILPVSFTHSIDIFLAFVFGISGAIFFFKTIQAFLDEIKVIVTSVVMFFAISIFSIYIFVQKETVELETNGITTIANIKDGSSSKSSSTLEIVFTTTNGQNIFSEVSVSRRKFDDHYIGESVEVIYSPSVPTLVRLKH